MTGQLPLTFDDLPPGLEGPGREIAREILARRGRRNAIPVADLVKRTGLGERRVRLMVRRLVDEHNLSILSLKGGYYVPAEPGEIRDYCRTQMRHAVSCIARVRQVTRNSRLEELMGQLELEMNKTADPVNKGPLPVNAEPSC